MFEMTTLEKVYKHFYKENLNPYNMSKVYLSTILERFNAQEFKTDPVQSLSKDDNVYSEELFINAKSDIAVLRRPRYRPHHIMHKHDFIEFTYVYNGVCKFIGPNEEEVMLKEGDLLLLATNIDHQLHTDADDSIIFHIAVRRSTFDKAFMMLLDSEDILAQFFSRIIYGSSLVSYVLFEVGGDEKIKALILEMYQEMQLSHRTSKRMLNVYFEWLCVYLMRSYDCKVWIEDAQPRHVDMMKILDYMRDSYKDISLEEIAQKFSYSKNYLCKIIKKYTGKTYGKLISDIRMQKSCQLLKKSEISTAEIASIVGYEDVSSFYRSFKNIYKLTPAKYRLQNKDIENE
ncbi:helix-turn-helix domain-containing protein [Clostridium magnum]|uniref:HTH-type transcriptional regulator ChbR n=1 Tax=Clostridium magnum DSM 2767 TaxID=1121326 RepID=A0A161X5K5_9CLOT|nr:helix-turn-helix domain-containing protein [Clostridium magnum]KZL89256.1 HTH-type transcriptional regulator ChbR [Clostridium magnum DSM 2767]SHI97320.1 AraC-type DNA-binding protein [Clostridium magnum DSM 2767]